MLFVEYLLSAAEVDRVTSSEIKRKKLIESLQQKSRTFDGSYLEDYSAVGIESFSLKLSKSMKPSLSNPRYEGYYQEDITPEKIPSSSRRTKGFDAEDLRLPHVTFAVKLETVLMELSMRKIAADFIYPVSGPIAKDYYTKIANPICLADMREKVAKYQYITVRSFVDDLGLMMSNAILFNGKGSPVAKNAQLLFQYAMDSLDHERKLLGPEKDSFAILEDAILDKYEYLHRPMPGRRLPLPSNSAFQAMARPPPPVVATDTVPKTTAPVNPLAAPKANGTLVSAELDKPIPAQVSSNSVVDIFENVPVKSEPAIVAAAEVKDEGFDSDGSSEGEEIIIAEG